MTKSIFDFKVKTLGAGEIDFGDFKGKYLLLVNVASECGYTPQYEDLQALHEGYGDKVVVLAFPSNDFGGQEPGTDEEIDHFCKVNYAVSFPVSRKIKVVGENQHPVFEWLAGHSQSPTWNFCKYLINPEGDLMGFFPSSVNPGEIIEHIQ